MSKVEMLRKALQERISQENEQLARESGRTVEEIETIREIVYQEEIQMEWLK